MLSATHKTRGLTFGVRAPEVRGVSLKPAKPGPGLCSRTTSTDGARADSAGSTRVRVRQSDCNAGTPAPASGAEPDAKVPTP